MLLTAVTDYGTRGKYQPALVSATRDIPAPVSALALDTTPARPAIASDEVLTAKKTKDALLLKPNLPQLFIAKDTDPVMARHEAEMEERASRGKPANRNRLKWDKGGWYREEVALTTAYCPCSKCCGTHSPGITSIGKNAWEPGLAADPIYLEYGTKVFVPGYGLSVVDDTGGAMRRHWRSNGLLHIDVRMMYHYEARQWGKQYLRVKIYDDE